MPNIIRFPLSDSSINTKSPRYCFINVENIFDFKILTNVSGYASVLQIIYNKSGLTSFRFVYSAVYYKYHVVTDADLTKLKNLIKSANKNPNSAPVFEVIKNPIIYEKEPRVYQVEKAIGGLWLDGA